MPGGPLAQLAHEDGRRAFRAVFAYRGCRCSTSQSPHSARNPHISSATRPTSYKSNEILLRSVPPFAPKQEQIPTDQTWHPRLLELSDSRGIHLDRCRSRTNGFRFAKKSRRESVRASR